MFNLDRKFLQSPSFHLRGPRSVQRRARSKISTHDRSLEIFNPEGRDRIFSIPGPYARGRLWVDSWSIFGQFPSKMTETDRKPTENRPKTDPPEDPDGCLPLRRGEGLFHAQYDWTTGAPDNGNEWRKVRAVPLSYLLRSLACTLFNKGGSRRAFRLPGTGGDHFHCTVEPSPGHIRCRSVAEIKVLSPFEMPRMNFSELPGSAFCLAFVYQEVGKGGLRLRGVASMTALAVLTVLAVLESGNHLALLLLILQNTVPRGSRDGFDGFESTFDGFQSTFDGSGSFGGCGGFGRDGYPP